MARLCVRVLDNSHPTDPSLNPLRTQIGDVVCIVEDGHVFTKAEMTNGHYKIVDMPGVPAEKLAYLTDHVEDKDGQMIQRRAVNLDPTALKSLKSLKAAISAMVVTKPVVSAKVLS